MLWSKSFWIDATERAIKTFAQSALAVVGVGVTDIMSVNWMGVLSVGAGAAFVSLLTSVASERTGISGTASLTTVVEPVR